MLAEAQCRPYNQNLPFTMALRCLGMSALCMWTILCLQGVGCSIVFTVSALLRGLDGVCHHAGSLHATESRLRQSASRHTMLPVQIQAAKPVHFHS